jgi:membrane associated rhomboid family serine protease
VIFFAHHEQYYIDIHVQILTFAVSMAYTILMHIITTQLLWISNVSLFKCRPYWWLCLCLPVFNHPERLCILILWYCLVPVLPVVCWRAHVLLRLITCVCLHNGVQHSLCCVFALFYFVLCTLNCQLSFLDCPLVFSNV